MDKYDEETHGVTIEDDGASQAENTPSAQATVKDRMQPEQPSRTAEKGKEETPSKEETTDRGTKVAKEPESRFYQQLKNENADMRRILSNPDAVKEYLRTLEGTQTPKEGEKDDLADIGEKVLTPDGQVDLVKLAQYMDTRVTKRIDEGLKYGVENRIAAERIKNSFEADKLSTRSAHPELDPESKEKYDPDLERLVGERFIAQGGYEGKVSLKTVVEQTYKDIAKWQGSGRKQAETEIVRKKAGAIQQTRVQAESQETEEENMRPEEILAARVRNQVFGRS